MPLTLSAIDAMHQAEEFRGAGWYLMAAVVLVVAVMAWTKEWRRKP